MVALETLAGEIAPGPLAELRGRALARVRAAGVPTVRDEAWKYTDLRLLQDVSFATSGPASSAPQAEPALLSTCAHRLVFVDGRLERSLCRDAGLPAGVQLRSFAELQAAEPEALAALLARYATDEAQVFSALNAACARDGAVIDVAPGVVLDAPLLVAFLHTADAARLFSAPLVIVRAAANSSVSVLELHHGEAGAQNLAAPLTHLAAAKGSRIEHWRVQHEAGDAIHLGHLEAVVDADARVATHAFAFGARLARLEMVAALEAPGASVVMNGLFNAGAGQHLDHQTRIDHRAPHTTSEELFKGLAGADGRGVFRGQVIVRPNAQKISARQASHNLLLSADAEIDTKPELEIYADDVSCAHGATVGQLDDGALFYLRSRGVPEAEARALLVFGFTQEVVEQVAFAPLRGWLAEQLAGRADVPLPSVEDLA